MSYLWALLLRPCVVLGGVIDWPRNLEREEPDLSGGANIINDLNIRMNDCGLFISTSGNYHMALGELMGEFEGELHNVVWTTSRPITLEVLEAKRLVLGNVLIDCVPDVAIGPWSVMEGIREYWEDEPIAFMKNQGNVILVRKGSNIKDIWDMDDIATSDISEPGSYRNYRDSMYNMAKAQKGAFKARRLVDRVYRNRCSWGPIMHRGIPQSLINGECEAGLMFYHLALYTVRHFPDAFDFIPLGGTKDNPDPVKGNKVSTLYIVPLNDSEVARRLIDAYMSDRFTQILNSHGILRP